MDYSPVIQADNKNYFYDLLLAQVKSMFSQERNFLTNISNFCAIIYTSLPDLNWAGFYFRQGKELVLGPFQGKPACVRLPSDRGVCWESVNTRRSVMVKNVHEFPGHIACDSASQSEMVLPIFYKDEVIGVLDIDSPVIGRFDDEDKDGVEKMIDILVKSTDFSPIGIFYK